MKLLLCIVLTTQIGFSQWENKNGNLPQWNSQGWALDAIDSMTAVIGIVPQIPAISNTLFITTDGGNFWNALAFSTPRVVTDISIIDRMHIWVTTSEPAEILSTTNGGVTWNIQFAANDTITSFFNYIKMFDLDNGVAMGDAPYPPLNKPVAILKTSDGGQNWDLIDNNFINGFSLNLWCNVDFITPEIGFFRPSYDSSSKFTAFKTTNGGQTWLDLNDFSSSVSGLKFLSEDYGMVYGHTCPYAGTYIIRTTDTGLTWDSTYLHSNYTFVCSDIEYVENDPSKVWLAILDTLYFSQDSGKTWLRDPLSSSFTRGKDLQIVDGKVCWFLSESVYRNLNADVFVSTQEDALTVPGDFILYQNYPNPFNPSTTIKYTISEPGYVKLTIFDIIGREIKTLQDGFQNSGVYSSTFNSENLPSGVYIYKLQAGEYIGSRKMLLLK